MYNYIPMLDGPSRTTGKLSIKSLEEGYQTACFGYMEPIVLRTSPDTRKAIMTIYDALPHRVHWPHEIQARKDGILLFNAARVEETILMPDNVVEYWIPRYQAVGAFERFGTQPIAILTLEREDGTTSPPAQGL
jgi:hypothetical protein